MENNIRYDKLDDKKADFVWSLTRERDWFGRATGKPSPPWKEADPDLTPFPHARSAASPSQLNLLPGTRSADISPFSVSFLNVFFRNKDTVSEARSAERHAGDRPQNGPMASVNSNVSPVNSLSKFCLFQLLKQFLSLCMHGRRKKFSLFGHLGFFLLLLMFLLCWVFGMWKKKNKKPVGVVALKWRTMEQAKRTVFSLSFLLERKQLIYDSLIDSILEYVRKTRGERIMIMSRESPSQ